jgi:hypothetical protein
VNVNRLELRRLEVECEESGLELLDPDRGRYRCRECGLDFSPDAGRDADEERERLGVEWWYCPNGCNWPDED